MCVLRAVGTDFDVDAFLATSGFEMCGVRRKGEPRLRSKPDGPRNESSGFNADVSTKAWNDLPGQIQDAKVFLSENEEELRRLRSFPGVEGVELDFPIELRVGENEIVVQSDRLPASLLLAAGRLGIDIVLTLYPPSDEATSSSNDGTGGTV
jgi:hypothetical protein